MKIGRRPPGRRPARAVRATRPCRRAASCSEYRQLLAHAGPASRRAWLLRRRRSRSRPLTPSSGRHLERSVLDMVQEQSHRLQAMSDELETVRASLNERKIVERAKGLLMAHRRLERRRRAQDAAPDRDEPEAAAGRRGRVDAGNGRLPARARPRACRVEGSGPRNCVCTTTVRIRCFSPGLIRGLSLAVRPLSRHLLDSSSSGTSKAGTPLACTSSVGPHWVFRQAGTQRRVSPTEPDKGVPIRRGLAHQQLPRGADAFLFLSFCCFSFLFVATGVPAP